MVPTPWKRLDCLVLITIISWFVLFLSWTPTWISLPSESSRTKFKRVPITETVIGTKDLYIRSETRSLVTMFITVQSVSGMEYTDCSIILYFNEIFFKWVNWRSSASFSVLLFFLMTPVIPLWISVNGPLKRQANGTKNYGSQWLL